MAQEHSFDVVSDFDRQELVNAVDQARREITTRYDFKGVTVEIELGEMRDASAHFDLQLFSPLRCGDVVRARVSPDKVTLLHPPGYNHFETLRRKLHWNR